LAPLREYSLFFANKGRFLFFSQSRKDTKRIHTTFATLRLCESIFLFSQRKKAFRRLRANPLFLSRKEEKPQRKVIQPLRLGAFARVFFYFLKERKPFAGSAPILSFFLAKKKRR
jgi:hypothetical protein